MTNKLIRTGTFQTIPGTPYRPAIPAYQYVETRTAYRVVTSRGAWVRVRNPASGGSQGEFTTVWDPNYPTTAYEPYTYTVVVDVPAQPAQQSTPSVRVDSPPRGWTSFAHSMLSVNGGGELTFQGALAMQGAAVGFSQNPVNPQQGYGHIPHGLYLSNGVLRNLRTGASLGTYTAAHVLKVRVEGGLVKLYRDATLLATEASTYVPGAMWMAASLYGSYDTIDAPTLTELASGEGVVHLPRLTVYGAPNAHNEGRVRLPALRVTSPAASYGSIRLPVMGVYATGDPVHNEVRIRLPALGVSGDGYLGAEPVSYGGFSLPVPVPHGLLMPAVAINGTVHLPRLGLLGASGAYGTASLRLPALRVSSWPENENQFDLFTDIGLRIDFSTDVQQQADHVFGLELDIGFSAQVYLGSLLPMEFTLDIGFGLGVSETSVDLPLLLGLDIGFEVEGHGVEAWCVNLAHGGSTAYENYAFDSFARIGNRYFGANAAGVHELDGPNDNGTDIDAALSPGSLDLGSPYRKNVVQCFVQTAGDRPLQVRMLVEGEQYDYEADDYSPKLQAQRIKFGRGLAGNFIRPTFYNECGGDFQIEAIEFNVADKTRKL